MTTTAAHATGDWRLAPPSPRCTGASPPHSGARRPGLLHKCVCTEQHAQRRTWSCTATQQEAEVTVPAGGVSQPTGRGHTEQPSGPEVAAEPGAPGGSRRRP